MASIEWVGALCVAFPACISDVRTKRIPNALTFGGAFTGILFHLIGGEGLLTGVTGWLLGIAIFLPLFLLRGMGAGDVKLLGAVGAWVGPIDTIWVALYSSLAGGCAAILVALSCGYLRTAIGNVGSLLTYWCLVGPRPMPGLSLERSTGPRVAYAVPILAGTMATLWFR